MVKRVLENMLALQNLELQTEKASDESDRQIMLLRSRIPRRLLMHYDCLMANGRKGVALVRNGMCSECHQEINGNVLGAAACGHPVQLCSHCRRFLYLPVDETLGLPRTTPGARSINLNQRRRSHV